MIFFIFFLLFFNVDSLSMIKIPESVMISESNEIVQGTISSKTFEKFGKLIITKYTIKIANNGLIKNSYINKAPDVDFFILGGEITNSDNKKEKLEVPGLVNLMKDREYILFLKKHESMYGLNGVNQGCLRVETIPTGKIVIPCGKYQNSIYTSEIDKNTGYLTLDKFIAKVKEFGGL